MYFMAVPAPYGHEIEKKSGSTPDHNGLPPIKKAAARLYAQGFKRADIARTLVDHLAPKMERPMEQRLADARRKLRNWEQQGAFLDFLWQQGLLKANLELPAVIDGVMQKAKRGRVDAARLVLEVTGRHNPKGDVGSANVVIQFGSNIPRPDRRPDIDLEPEDVVEEDVA